MSGQYLQTNYNRLLSNLHPTHFSFLLYNTAYLLEWAPWKPKYKYLTTDVLVIGSYGIMYSLEYSRLRKAAGA